MSAQAWNIYAKVADMDRALRAEPGLRPRVREVHPEVCFWAWSGHRAMRFSKRTSAGRAERRSLVDGYFGVEAYDRVRGQFLARDVADDDILDAFAALWTAERIRDGRACTLPESPPTDTLGLRMEIVY